MFHRVTAVHRRSRITSALVTLLTLALAPVMANAQDGDKTPPKITIDLKPTAILQGHDLRATIRVAPESGNRLLAVRIDAPTFYAATERELIGEYAQRTHTFNWQKLPAGEYLIEALVTGANGKLTRVHRQFTVHGMQVDEQPAVQTRRRGRRGP